MATATEASQQANRSAFDPKRLVVIFYLLAGFVLALFLAQVFESIWARAGWSNPDVIEGVDGWRLANVLGYALALGLAALAYFHPRSHALSMDIASELMKVTWPTWGETRVGTTAVIVASVVAAIILFFIDTIAYKLMVEWMPALWGSL